MRDRKAPRKFGIYPNAVSRACRRRFVWISSVVGKSQALVSLDAAMMRFYSERATRDSYQALIDAESSAQPDTESAMRRAILRHRPSSVLEVGCGSGRIYGRLRAEGLKASYTGLELAPTVIQSNIISHSEARWICGSIYDTPIEVASIDVVFAFFVLEHCVYPERALANMLEWTKPGGATILVFPDFVEMGRLGSQTLGSVEGLARDRLRRGDLFNALLNLYESRIRLPRALRQAVRRVGPFPVNLQPRCLFTNGSLEPDMDAVYIASKQEVAEWAERRGLRVRYPEGTKDNFRMNTLIELQRVV